MEGPDGAGPKTRPNADELERPACAPVAIDRRGAAHRMVLAARAEESRRRRGSPVLPRLLRLARAVVLLCGIALLAAAIGRGVWARFLAGSETASRMEDQMVAAGQRRVDVVLRVEGAVWDKDAGASRLPVHIVGTRVDGVAVDEVQYVGSDSATIRLACGSYRLSVAASPIAADGSVFSVPDITVQLRVAQTDAEGLDAAGYGALRVEEAPASSVSDEEVERALAYAAQDPTLAPSDIERLSRAVRAGESSS